jgi:hypothetical protein
MSTIRSRRPNLGSRHYLLNPSLHNFWVKLSHWRLQDYRRQFGDDFCIVLNRSKTVDDAYVLPYGLFKHLIYSRGWPKFTTNWDLTISKGHVRLAGQRFPVGRFHNFFELLDMCELQTPSAAA